MIKGLKKHEGLDSYDNNKLYKDGPCNFHIEKSRSTLDESEKKNLFNRDLYEQIYMKQLKGFSAPNKKRKFLN